MLALAVAAVPRAASAATSWAVVPSPSPGNPYSDLNGITATSASSLWAVGSATDSSQDVTHTLIMRGDGSGWSVVPSPDHSTALTARDVLLGVSASSPGNAWAVGYWEVQGYYDYAIPHAFSVHWDGTSWQEIPVPEPSASNEELTGVTAVSDSDAYAVGYYYSSGVSHALVLHWNGSAWTQQQVPDVGTYVNQLTSVYALSSSDIWAVGIDRNSGDNTNHPLILHYLNGSWTVAPIASPTAGAYLHSVTAVSADDAWAVGEGNAAAVAYHWDGSQWSEVPTPRVSPGRTSYFYGVSATGPDQVWAVGVNYADSGLQVLVERWNGTAWSVETQPTQEVQQLGGSATATAVTSIPGIPTVWVSGYRLLQSGTSYTDRTVTIRGIGG